MQGRDLGVKRRPGWAGGPGWRRRVPGLLVAGVLLAGPGLAAHAQPAGWPEPLEGGSGFTASPFAAPGSLEADLAPARMEAQVARNRQIDAQNAQAARDFRDAASQAVRTLAGPPSLAGDILVPGPLADGPDRAATAQAQVGWAQIPDARLAASNARVREIVGKRR